MDKKVSNKTIIIAIIAIIILAILYFLIFVVDIFSYVKNYYYLQQAGENATKLRNEIDTLNNELDEHRTEYKQKKDRLENVINEIDKSL